MISIEEAFARLDNTIRPLAAETVSISTALHRVLTEPAHAVCDLPPFDQSAMDGYALRAADLSAPGQCLPLAGLVAAEEQTEIPELNPGTCQRIFTGGLMPRGADTMIPQELTERDGDQVIFRETRPAGANVRKQGEELQAGTELLPAGTRLTAGQIGALAMAGIGTVQVSRKPRAGILVTGNELVPPGDDLKPGQVYDANGPQTRLWFAARGIDAICEYAIDDPALIENKLNSLAERCDLIVTTGGVSVGDRDYIPEAATTIRLETVFHKVAQKPGKPLFFGSNDQTHLLGLPGNPGAVLVNLEIFVARALDRLEGTAEPAPRFSTAKTAAQFRPDPRRDCWVRVHMTISDGEQTIRPLTRQTSHMLSNLREANALAWLPKNEHEYPFGETLRVLLLDGSTHGPAKPNP